MARYVVTIYVSLFHPFERIMLEQGIRFSTPCVDPNFGKGDDGLSPRALTLSTKVTHLCSLVTSQQSGDPANVFLHRSISYAPTTVVLACDLSPIPAPRVPVVCPYLRPFCRIYLSLLCSPPGCGSLRRNGDGSDKHRWRKYMGERPPLSMVS